jgi:hypothetical protein
LYLLVSNAIFSHVVFISQVISEAWSFPRLPHGYRPIIYCVIQRSGAILPVVLDIKEKKYTIDTEEGLLKTYI